MLKPTDTPKFKQLRRYSKNLTVDFHEEVSKHLQEGWKIKDIHHAEDTGHCTVSLLWEKPTCNKQTSVK